MAGGSHAAGVIAVDGISDATGIEVGSKHRLFPGGGGGGGVLGGGGGGGEFCVLVGGGGGGAGRGRVHIGGVRRGRHGVKASP